MENQNQIRTHRVGSVTAGISMVAFGILFIVKNFAGTIDYIMIFRLWPLMLIGLGIEMLISNLRDRKFVYDKAAIFLIILVTFFAIGMAGADLCFDYMQKEIMLLYSR